MQTYKDLTVWQKSIDLVERVYTLTSNFPKEEQYGLTSQMRRAAISIASNIAEGKLRDTDQQFKQFLYIAFGSGGELETQLLIAKRIFTNARLNFSAVETLLEEIMRMLNKLITKLEPNAQPLTATL